METEKCHSLLQGMNKQNLEGNGYAIVLHKYTIMVTEDITIVVVYLSLHCNTLKTSAWHGVFYVMLIKDILVEATVNIKHNPKT